MGHDEAKRAKGLRLDLREAAVKPLKSGDAAIVPGDPEASNLVARISEEDDTLRMPPRKAGNRLSPAEVDVLTRWVQQGAKYAEHWALIPPRAEALPKVKRRRLATQWSGLLDPRPPRARRTASLARGRPVHAAASGQP